mgnify:CR=1 FL=1
MKRRKFLGKTALGTAAMVGFPSIVPASVIGKNAPSNKINIGQIGCGRIARSHDLIDTMAFDIANVMAVCDVDSNRMKDGKDLVDRFYQKKSGKSKYNGTKMYEDYHDMLNDKDLKELLKVSLQQLSGNEALVIQLYYVEELNVMEIAEVLEVSNGRVSQIKKSAIAKLRESMNTLQSN